MNRTSAMNSDDWFAPEPPAPETLHDKYTRRLTAWGYLWKDGRCAWEVSSAEQLYGITLAHYLVPVQKALNEDLMLGLTRLVYGNDWTRDPEAPALGRHHDPGKPMREWT